MFATKLRHMVFVCDKVISRNLRGARLGRISAGPNPGLNKRLQAFQEEGLKVDDDDAEEFIENSESSFYNTGETYNQHLNESLMGKYILKHQIVKEKYFKENMPNLLTWSEKEQIRHLYTTDPKEWTIERLAESFPVTEPVVKKLLKYPWKPASESRITRHDASALRNWRELKEGSLDIPEDLRQHFLKFSDRTIPPLDKKSIQIDLTKEKQLGEFQQIVDRCAAEENSKVIESNTGDLSDESESEVITHKYSKVVTLEQLANKIQKRIDGGQLVNVSDKIIVSEVKKDKSIVSNEYINEIDIHDNETKVLSNIEQKVEVTSYPERIRIPKKAYKRGATYKVNDCYYDDDGKFLYRVIGMTN